MTTKNKTPKVDFAALSFSEPEEVKAPEPKDNPLTQTVKNLNSTWNDKGGSDGKGQSKAISAKVPTDSVDAFKRHAYGAAKAVGRSARIRTGEDVKGVTEVTLYLRPEVTHNKKDKK